MTETPRMKNNDDTLLVDRVDNVDESMCEILDLMLSHKMLVKFDKNSFILKQQNHFLHMALQEQKLYDLQVFPLYTGVDVLDFYQTSSQETKNLAHKLFKALIDNHDVYDKLVKYHFQIQNVINSCNEETVVFINKISNHTQIVDTDIAFKAELLRKQQKVSDQIKENFDYLLKLHRNYAFVQEFITFCHALNFSNWRGIMNIDENKKRMMDLAPVHTSIKEFQEKQNRIYTDLIMTFSQQKLIKNDSKSEALNAIPQSLPQFDEKLITFLVPDAQDSNQYSPKAVELEQISPVQQSVKNNSGKPDSELKSAPLNKSPESLINVAFADKESNHYEPNWSLGEIEKDLNPDSKLLDLKATTEHNNKYAITYSTTHIKNPNETKVDLIPYLLSNRKSSESSQSKQESTENANVLVDLYEFASNINLNFTTSLILQVIHLNHMHLNVFIHELERICPNYKIKNGSDQYALTMEASLILKENKDLQFTFQGLVLNLDRMSDILLTKITDIYTNYEAQLNKMTGRSVKSFLMNACKVPNHVIEAVQQMVDALDVVVHQHSEIYQLAAFFSRSDQMNSLDELNRLMRNLREQSEPIYITEYILSRFTTLDLNS